MLWKLSGCTDRHINGFLAATLHLQTSLWSHTVVVVVVVVVAVVVATVVVVVVVTYGERGQVVVVVVVTYGEQGLVIGTSGERGLVVVVVIFSVNNKLVLNFIVFAGCDTKTAFLSFTTNSFFSASVAMHIFKCINFSTHCFGLELIRSR